MTKISELFQRAYHLEVVDGDTDAAIALCREILTTAPEHHEARMLLANMLDDRDNETDSAESYRHYIEAIERCDGYNKAWWDEENPIAQLAIWEQKHGSPAVTDVLLAIDCILGGSKAAIERLTASVAPTDQRAKNLLHLVIQKFIATRS